MYAILVSLALVGAAPDDKIPALPTAKAETVAMPGGELLWPQFRGPGGEGHVSQTGLPLEWSETKNIAWKVPIAGLGWSSAVIQGDQVWLTTAVELPLPEKPAAAAETKPAEPQPAETKSAETKAPAPNAADAKPAGAKPAAKPPEVYPPISLRALCYDRNTGKLVHDVEIFKIENPGRIHKKNSHASPTPVIEGNRLYLHFGKHGTACITNDGQIVWKMQELKYEHRHGPGGSPVVHQDLLLLSCDGTDVQYVVGLDKNTGKIRWKQDRKGRMAYTTPLLVTVDGQVQLISSGGDGVIAYEPETGKEIWRCAYDGYSLVPRPVIAHGIVFICTGYDSPQVYAIKLGGQGDVTDTHVVWKIKKATMPRNASPLVVGDELYLVSDNGIASVLDCRTGEEIYHERIGGNFSASPLLVDGRIYLLDEDGKCTVIAPGKEYRPLGESTLDGRTLASLSVAGKAFYLRTDSHLYRIENQ